MLNLLVQTLHCLKNFQIYNNGIHLKKLTANCDMLPSRYTVKIIKLCIKKGVFFMPRNVLYKFNK